MFGPRLEIVWRSLTCTLPLVHNGFWRASTRYQHLSRRQIRVIPIASEIIQYTGAGIETDRVARAYTWQRAKDSDCKSSGLHGGQPWSCLRCVRSVLKVVFVVQHTVVGRTRCTEEPRVALQVEVKFGGVCDVLVDL